MDPILIDHYRNIERNCKKKKKKKKKKKQQKKKKRKKEKNEYLTELNFESIEQITIQLLFTFIFGPETVPYDIHTEIAT